MNEEIKDAVLNDAPADDDVVMMEAADDSVFVDARSLDHVSAAQHLDDMTDKGDEPPDDTRVAFGAGGAREESEMDMTPMVDVTFLLLIFFMVTAAFSLQKSLQVPTPKNEEASTNVQQQDPQEDPDMVTVRVDEFNSFHVITAEWEEEAPSEQELLIQLRRARGAARPPSKLLVQAHGEALHEKVVTALDAGSEVGMEEIQLMTVEEDE